MSPICYHQPISIYLIFLYYPSAHTPNKPYRISSTETVSVVYLLPLSCKPEKENNNSPKDFKEEAYTPPSAPKAEILIKLFLALTENYFHSRNRPYIKYLVSIKLNQTP